MYPSLHLPFMMVMIFNAVNLLAKHLISTKRTKLKGFVLVVITGQIINEDQKGRERTYVLQIWNNIKINCSGLLDENRVIKEIC